MILFLERMDEKTVKQEIQKLVDKFEKIKEGREQRNEVMAINQDALLQMVYSRIIRQSRRSFIP